MKKTKCSHASGPGNPAGIDAGHMGYEALRWRVPVDDTHTLHATLAFAPVVDGKPTGKFPPDRQENILEVPPGDYKWDEETGWIARNDQDRCVQESQGLICDRTAEHLGYSDKGVILLRGLYRRSMDGPREGLDPLGVLRDPNKNRVVEIIPAESPST